MSSPSNSVSLQTLFRRALQSASEASDLPSMDDRTQDLVGSALRDLETLSQAINVSSMFSPNESLEDLATAHLPYMLVEYVIAEVEDKLRTSDRGERMRMLQNSQRHLQSFLHRVQQYDIIPEAEQNLYSKSSSGIKDPSKRRELKIKQYKAEKELRSTLDLIRKRRGHSTSDTGSGDDFGLIASMLTPSAPGETGNDEDDDDEALRHVLLLIIRLISAQTKARLESVEQELELLHSMPPSEPESSGSKTHEDSAWKLDPPIEWGGPDGKGPLMDSSGRPLRPFTILPGSASSERSRLQAEVFRPDHRLPTMTIDEYLEEEKRRGNFIMGGGPESQHAPTRSEQLTLDSEMDGTVEGDMKSEEKRQEDERWARYTDIHPKGEGNTMNRG